MLYIIPYTRCTSTYTCAVPMSMLPWFHDSLIPWFHYTINATLQKKCVLVSIWYFWFWYSWYFWFWYFWYFFFWYFLFENLILWNFFYRTMKETHSACHCYTGSAVQQPNKRNPQCLSLLHRRCSGTACQDEKDRSAIILLGISPSITRPSAFPMLWVPAFPPSPTFLSSVDNALEWAKEGRH